MDSAKRDIRKQLVESLLDIPFPKPPPLETRLHVSLTDATFLNCIGLEEVGSIFDFFFLRCVGLLTKHWLAVVFFCRLPCFYCLSTAFNLLRQLT